MEAEARKKEYLQASFFTFFLSLFRALSDSTSMQGMPAALAASTCLASPRMQHDARARHVGQLDGTSETLVLLCVVVLEHNLELNGLGELA